MMINGNDHHDEMVIEKKDYVIVRRMELLLVTNFNHSET